MHGCGTGDSIIITFRRVNTILIPVMLSLKKAAAEQGAAWSLEIMTSRSLGMPAEDGACFASRAFGNYTKSR